VTAVLALMNEAANSRLRATERQRANLARFFAPGLVEELVQIETPLSMTRYQRAAVLFVDMLGFTTYSSRMAPDAMIGFLRDLLALLSEAVFTHHGIVDKFLGDGLLAVFGPPLQSRVDACNAARCAFEILQSVERWNEENSRSGDAAVKVAIGIHYGDVVQGDVGSNKRLELTVLGDTVNIASMVEAYCRPLGAAVLVTHAFVDALHAEGGESLVRRFADEGCHRLRGHLEPMRLYGIKRPAVQSDGLGAPEHARSIENAAADPGPTA
jgi:class 3 adenylate cyclase